jgi:hypothetical protein
MESSGDGRRGELGNKSDRPAETAALLREVLTVLEASTASSPPAAAQRWPDRLRASASMLCNASLRIRAVLLDDDRFARLTDPSFSAEQVLVPVREFNMLLETALQALIDLAGYDNPDQEYPDLTSWFQFRCPNVVYGRYTDTVRIEDFGADNPPPS